MPRFGAGWYMPAPPPEPRLPRKRSCAWCAAGGSVGVASGEKTGYWLREERLATRLRVVAVVSRGVIGVSGVVWWRAGGGRRTGQRWTRRRKP